MTLVAFLRHGPTSWNAEHRIQGRSDLPLSPAGAALMRRLRLPAELDGFRWLTSPLKRAAATTRLLHGETTRDERLIEMDWGAWEGLTAAIIALLANRMAARGAGGLDLCPPGGESPRRVQARIRPLLAQIGAQPRPHVCVTHKGVIRAAFSLATGWDMMGKPPVKLTWQAFHVFDADRYGGLRLVQANLALEQGWSATWR